MTFQLPEFPWDELTSSCREHLPVYGSCNVTSTVNTLSGPVRRLKHLYWNRSETKVHDAAISSTTRSSGDFYLTTTRWFCAILEATRFSSAPSSDSGRSHRSGWSFISTPNARLWLAQRASSRPPSNGNVFSEAGPVGSIKPSCTDSTGGIVHDVR